MSEILTIEDVMEHVGILSGAGFADGAFFERSGRTQNSELAGSQIATSGAAIANAYRAQAERIEELEAGLRHIIRWCEQDSDMLTPCQILNAIQRMCHDALSGARDDHET